MGNVKCMENSSGKTPLQLKNAYLSRLGKEEEIMKDDEHKEAAKELIDEILDKKDEENLAKGLLDLSLLKIKSKKVTFRELAKEVSVNHESGEAKEVNQALIEFMEKVAKKVGEKKSIYKGKLIPLGSSAEGVRIKSPDEVDFNLRLDLKKVSVKLKNLSENDQTL